jgi:hypothetical protein
MIIKLKPPVIEKCIKFSEECVETNKYYASRGQKNLEKIKNDILVGKLGEWAAYQLLKEQGIEVGEPDLAIYKGGAKSHSADLEGSGHKFSVKTQTLKSVELYGMSWLMEKKALSKFEGHKVVLCLQLADDTILIQNIVKFEDMMAVQKEPKLTYLTSKAAFYYQDLLCDFIKKA